MTDPQSRNETPEVARGKPVWALGLMSGTSMDGVDAALLETDGEGITSFGPSLFRPLDPADSADMRRIVADPLRYRGTTTAEDAATVAAAEAEATRLHGEAAIDLLARAPADLRPAVIGFPGQTVAHCPLAGINAQSPLAGIDVQSPPARAGAEPAQGSENGWTWQLGDGERLARALNRPVVWDFRSRDLTEGGQGAPLAPFFHFALAKNLGRKLETAGPVAFLNIGGVANVTWIDPRRDRPEDPGALTAFDTGPGNALLDDWMLRHTGRPLDADGATAAGGNPDAVDPATNFIADHWGRPPPKSLDRNAFATLLDGLSGLSVADGAAVLTRLAVRGAAMAVPHLPSPPALWLICGGGRRNRTMMRGLSEALSAPVKPVEAVGLDGDFLEAQAFAWLAVRVLRGLPTSAPSTTGCRVPTCGGRIALPFRNST